MGRKPNQMILEFFDRGAKLPDGSNRYEHTCRACGEVFPKGRIESLMAHLKTKCKADTMEDVRRTLLLSREIPNFESEDTGYACDGTYQNEYGPISKHSTSGERNLTGLEVLAEAGRQIGYPQENEHSGIGQNNIIDPNLERLLTKDLQSVHEHEGRGLAGKDLNDLGMTKVFATVLTACGTSL